MRSPDPDAVAYEPPPLPCPHHAPGEPAAVPFADGKVCLGREGEPCGRCVRYGMGLTGQAEWLAWTMREFTRGK